MLNNRLIVAAAGSGKTSFIVEEALKIIDQKVLITTFTEANEAEIRNRIIQKNKFIPANVTVQTWFSVLLRHGVKPYQGYLFDPQIKGMIWADGKSGIKYVTKKRIPIYYAEDTEFERHYFSKDRKIFHDKIAKFLMLCDKTSEGRVVDRLSRIYSYIFIDEIQDLSGYDLEFLKLLFNSNINTLLVGDPRQGTYSTSNSAKNKKYAKSGILEFFQNIKNINIDDKLLTTNHRSNHSICKFSNNLFLEHPQTNSGNNNTTGHDGIFLVRSKDILQYLYQYQPTQLRYDRKKTVENGYSVMNFGESKGLSFDRVLIYPTKPIEKWLKNNNCDLETTSRAKLYVAITRARYSVGFVYDFSDQENMTGFQKFYPNTQLQKSTLAA
ncbi:MAG: ATP-dependent helicase [Niabella sp.]|nr:MAG: ATP-dependent helicase [Niabella sp.]